MLPQGQSRIQEGDPEPAHQQEQQHEREGENEPGAEIHRVALWEEAGGKRAGRRSQVSRARVCAYVQRKTRSMLK